MNNRRRYWFERTPIPFLASLQLLVWLIVVALSNDSQAQLPKDSVRRTPLVNVIENAEKTVVALFAIDQTKSKGAAGTGSIIHPGGYVLTNNHVLPAKAGQAVYQGKAIPFRVVGRMPDHDFAIVKLESKKEWPSVVVGQNNDLMNGETVITAGNPGGRGVIYTAGIVSNKNLIGSTGNALAMTQFNSNARPAFIQFDAASNQGSSGGPLLDLESRLIGIVSGGFVSEENVNYAIPIDRVRKFSNAMMAPEIRHQKQTGITIDPNTSDCRIMNVLTKSAAELSGLQPGETIVRVNGMAAQQVLDWVIAMDVLLPDVETLIIEVQGKAGLRTVSLTPDPLPAWPAVEGVVNTKSGLDFKLYNGHFDKLPDFASLTVENEGTIDELSLEAMTTEGRQDFVAQLDSYIEIDRDGLYRLTIISDDGSQLFLHDELLLDNDFNHPAQPVSRLTRLAKGLHPLRIDYFQGHSAATLQLHVTRVDDRTWDETPVPLRLLREVR